MNDQTYANGFIQAFFLIIAGLFLRFVAVLATGSPGTLAPSMKVAVCGALVDVGLVLLMIGALMVAITYGLRVLEKMKSH